MYARTEDFRPALLERLRKDNRLMVAYLNEALMDSEELFRVALRDVAEARGVKLPRSAVAALKVLGITLALPPRKAA